MIFAAGPVRERSADATNGDRTGRLPTAPHELPTIGFAHDTGSC
jgi:hypothetical protein